MRPVRPLVLAAVAATSVGLALPATAAPSTPTAIDGTWNFHIADEAALDVGSVRAFTLHVSGFVG